MYISYNKQKNDISKAYEKAEDKINVYPVHFEIVGDTSHLFADEDFEKKEAVLLGVVDYDDNNN